MSLALKTARADDAPLMPGQLRLMLETSTEIVLVSGHGLWTPAHLDSHLRSYAVLLARLRRQGSRVRVLVDLKDVGIQTPEVTEVLAAGTETCHQDGDRIAMLVPGSLAKMQMRRILGNHVHNYFVSETAARLWLSSGN